jgi:hypothetical protein
MAGILGSAALRNYTARGGVMALLSRLPASTLAIVALDIQDAPCDEVAEALLALVNEAGIINCGADWPGELEAAQAARAEAAGLFEEIDAFGFTPAAQEAFDAV